MSKAVTKRFNGGIIGATKKKQPATGIGNDKDILIRCTREGKDAYEAVYKASLSEWTRITGQTEEETFLEFDCGDIKDEKLFEEICNREEQDVLMSQLYDIPFVIMMY